MITEPDMPTKIHRNQEMLCKSIFFPHDNTEIARSSTVFRYFRADHSADFLGGLAARSRRYISQKIRDRRQVRNQPRKAVSGFFIILFLLLLCAFPGDEIMASSPASPQPRLVFGRQENRPAHWPRFGASVTTILGSAESLPSDDFN
jgi:hypothetical protein